MNHKHLMGMVLAGLLAVAGLGSTQSADAAGSRIFFLNFSHGDGNGIWSVNADGSDLKPVMVHTEKSKADFRFFGLAASRDGKHLAYEIQPGTSSGYSLWLLGVEPARLQSGEDLLQSEPVPCFEYSLASRLDCVRSLVSAEDGGRYQASFTYDGKRVAYSRFINVAYEIFLTDLAGSVRTNITQDNQAMNAMLSQANTAVSSIPTDPAALKKMQNQAGTVKKPVLIGVHAGGSISFAANGKQMAFVCGRDSSKDPIAISSSSDGNAEICVLNLDRSGFKRLTNNKAEDLGPSFSPDGKHIAFDSNRGGNYEIYLMNADGGGARQLTKMPGNNNTAPCFSPDGKQIVFSSRDTSSNHGSLYIMNADGSGLKNLTEGTNLEPFSPVFPGCGSYMRE